jgi:hypothetical protein
MSRIVVLLAALVACGGAETPAPEPAPAPKAEAPAPAPEAPKARVFFSEPADGAKVKSPVKLVFGVEGMEVKPAGELVENTGHHHVIIGPAGIAEGQMVPKDEKHIHFGAGQTEAEIELPPGDHKLTMQFADGNHMSYGEVMAATITVTVEE